MQMSTSPSQFLIFNYTDCWEPSPNGWETSSNIQIKMLQSRGSQPERCFCFRNVEETGKSFSRIDGVIEWRSLLFSPKGTGIFIVSCILSVLLPTCYQQSSWHLFRYFYSSTSIPFSNIYFWRRKHVRMLSRISVLFLRGNHEKNQIYVHASRSKTDYERNFNSLWFAPTHTSSARRFPRLRRTVVEKFFLKSRTL